MDDARNYIRIYTILKKNRNVCDQTKNYNKCKKQIPQSDKEKYRQINSKLKQNKIDRINLSKENK